MSKIRIAAASDLHGNIGFQVPKCDLLILAGDYTPLWSTAERQQSKREYYWWTDKFIPWLLRQRDVAGFEKAIIGGGNHDCFMKHIDTRDDAYRYTDSFDWIVPAWPYGGDATATIAFRNLKIGVHSMTPTIHNRPWPFSYQRSSAAHEFAIDELHDAEFHGEPHDIIVSHGPPAGMLDKTSEGKHAGCPYLAGLIFRSAPKLVLCGHIHEERGNTMKIHNTNGGMTKIANVSIVDRAYSAKGGKFRVFDVE